MEKTLKIADGQNVLIHLRRNVGEAPKDAANPLSKIPYLNRLYRNMSYGSESSDVYVLVTPRLILNEEAADVAVVK